ncbi:NACHT domain-containing protein [Saccharopolyspora sp. K220]|nr:NACHT domain-containing protein [Saccharopolyspora soli]
MAQLATRVSYSESMICKVEKGTRTPDLALAKALDEVLETGGVIARTIAAGRASTPVIPAQLPPPPPDLYGRARELHQLTEFSAAKRSPVVVLEGMAGAGKTALGVHWAHQHAASYPDGVFYAPLHGHTGRAPAEPGDVLAGLLSDLGAKEIPATVDGRARLWRSLTHSARILLILDDADSTEQVAPLLCGGSGSVVLITSRRRLSERTIRAAASRIPVPPLSRDTAARMLADLIHAGPDDHATLGAIAEGCSGLPVALRAAVEVIRDHPGRALMELAAHLSGPRHLHVLNTATARDQDSGIFRMVETSVRRLNPLAARVLQVLGARDIDVVTADDVADQLGISTSDAEEALVGLLGENLVLARPDGCHCPRLVRSVARSLNATSEAGDSTLRIAS